MNSLFSGLTDRSERVAVFLAVLELTKSGRIVLNDDNTVITFNREHSKVQSEQSDHTETEVSYS